MKIDDYTSKLNAEMILAKSESDVDKLYEEMIIKSNKAIGRSKDMILNKVQKRTARRHPGRRVFSAAFSVRDYGRGGFFRR
ncbi:hypothetical protein [Paenibacillus sp. GCM10027626]|uniref:hypothetical protein n=1 Tax=Paenibacillus sp. GCM10027626 TaxID=3273411 RepID=UPI00362ED638